MGKDADVRALKAELARARKMRPHRVDEILSELAARGERVDGVPVREAVVKRSPGRPRKEA